MKEKELKIKYAEICSNLAIRRLKPAFDQLNNLITDNGLGLYCDEHRNLEETYHYMLRYTVEGIPDPERQKIYRKLIVSVFELADKVNESVLLKSSLSIEYEKKKGISGLLPALQIISQILKIITCPARTHLLRIM